MASLGQLTAGIAHEIKNPLNFVNNFAELSRELLQELQETRSLLPGAEQDELIATLTGNLAKIVEHGRRADGIVTSMLAHSRGGTGERRATDLNALVEEALNLAFHGARARDKSFNITLERDLDTNLRPIELVPQDITRVLLNLFGNGFYAAAKRRQEGTDPAFQPSLRVTTRDLGDQVEIRVRDNGVGMPPEVRSKLFTPFFTTKPTGEGTGLGLSISYDIVVQQHGGTITVDSRPSEFTEFTVRLPRGLRAAETGRRDGSIGLSDMPPAHPDVEIVEATKASSDFCGWKFSVSGIACFPASGALFAVTTCCGAGRPLRSCSTTPTGRVSCWSSSSASRRCSPAARRGSSRRPPGSIDSGETPAAVAIRETQEETGLALIGEPVPIQRYLPSSGGSDESVYLFCGRVDATAAGGVHGLAEEHEDIRVVVKTLAEIEALLDPGAIESGHTLIGALLAAAPPRPSPPALGGWVSPA